MDYYGYYGELDNEDITAITNKMLEKKKRDEENTILAEDEPMPF